MRKTILGSLSIELRDAGFSMGALTDDLDAYISTPGGNEHVRTGALGRMFEWGIRYGREFWESEWHIQRVPAHRLVISREPVTHLNQPGRECFLIPLDHQTALYIHRPGMAPTNSLLSAGINWATTRFSDEMFWHPANLEPRVRAPWEPGAVRLESNRTPIAA